ncbi:hypothetical protein KFK09_026704 [Dendrobium nobile]|uniref:Uncharacterized protein n=1 Tax=Dendrobium nobile TaxID=94219 RepID=A0A8T3A9G3_DENNO|nr:hypothetical protein KFK09_026704 [Dendrobium nobile]
MLSIKAEYNVARECFNQFIGMLKETNPTDNLIPTDQYRTKKLVSKLGLTCTKIDCWRRDQNRQNRASDVGGLGSSLHTGGSVPHTEHRRRLRCLVENQLLWNCIVARISDRRINNGLMREQEKPMRNIHSFETHAASGEGSSGGSVEYSEYRIWSQAVGGMQHGRVYGLGAQAQAYEGMTSSTASSFTSSSHESLQAQQISALQAELEQVRKSQANWQAELEQFVVML